MFNAEWEYFSDVVEGETFAGMTTCVVNSDHHEQDRVDSEGSCLKKENQKVLVLDSQKEKLTQERIKVNIFQYILQIFASSFPVHICDVLFCSSFC